MASRQAGQRCPQRRIKVLRLGPRAFQGSGAQFFFLFRRTQRVMKACANAYRESAPAAGQA